MRSQRLLRASSTQGLCIFCACRLTSDIPLSSARNASSSQRRTIANTRPSFHSSGFAAASTGPNGSQPSWNGFDPSSSLSASEQREKALLRARREEEAKRRREAEERLARANEESRRQEDERARVARQRRDQDDAAKWRQQQGQLSKQGRGGNVKANDKRLKNRNNTSRGNSDGAKRNDPKSQTRGDQHARTPFTRSERQSVSEVDGDRERTGFTIRRLDSFRSDRNNNLGADNARQPQPERVRLPDFLSSSKTEEPPKPVVSGWGAGATTRKALEYGQDVPQDPTVTEKIRKDKPSNIDESKAPGALRQGIDASADSSDKLQQKQQAAPVRGGGFGLGAAGAVNSNSASIHDILNVASSSSRDPPPPPQQQEPVVYQDNDSSATYRPPPQDDGYPTQGDTRYRATSFDPKDYRENLANDSAEPQDDWQHLRPRKPEPAASSPYASGQHQSPPPDDADSIDRLFAEYREERDTKIQRRARPLQQQPDNPNIQNNTYTPFSSTPFDLDNSQRRCGRCGQVGHVARECSGPARMKCHSCGELGHVSRECPSNPRNQTRSSGYSQPLSESRFAERDADSFTRPRTLKERNPRERDSQDPRQVMMERMRSAEPVEDEASEEPSERMLKSRKFRDLEEPEKKKSVRRGRKFDDDEEEDDRAGRRGRRGFDEEEEEAGRSRQSRKAGKKEAKEAQKKAERAAERAAQQAERAGQIKLPEFISVQNLAQALGVRYEQFVERLENLGYDDIFAGKIFNTETSGMIAMEYDMEPIFETGVKEEAERDLKARPEVDAQDKDFLPTRPPVVTIMGHVDHGKTTILDYLRKSSVAAGEAGGITQHIGAFSVPLAASGKTITFLDTPGHAAFLAMRQRGANVTDIVILVVAADDSVKPQTLEAIKHARAANVPMIVAVNKCDKEEADVQRVKQDLARHGVEIEDFGGETQVVQVSGKTGLGMDELEENVVTLSEILDHRADAEGPVEGWVLEATTKKAGRVATVLVRRGTLRQGSVLVAGRTWARVRSLRNEAGKAITEAGPGMPVEIDGWRDQAAAGDEVLQAPNEQKATAVVEYRAEKAEREKTAVDMEAINAARQLEQQKRERERKAEQAKLQDPESSTAAEIEGDSSPKSSGREEVPFLIKADVSGSAEAVSAYMMSVSSPMISPLILSSTVGAVHESDVELAATAGGHIISFNLPLDEKVRALAESQGVRVLENNIIYRVLDDVKAVMEERLPPIVTQRVLGEAEVGAAFDIGVGGRKKVKIAGCKVRNGAIGKGSRVRVMRGEEKIYDGLISSLKNVRKDVQEMRKGSECGMGFENWEGFEVGDQIQTYEERSEKRTL